MELTIEQALKKAIELHKNNKFQEAEILYRKILHADPQQPDANHNLGFLALGAGKPEAALAYFKRALDGNPKDLQFWQSYIHTLIKVDQLENAKTMLEQAKLHGLSEEFVDRLDKSILAFSLANSTKEKNSHDRSASTSKLKKKMREKKEKKQATKSQNLAAELPPIQGPTPEELNSIIQLYNARNFIEAEGRSQSLTEQFPNHPFGWKALGIIFSQLGKHQEALIPNLKAVDLSPNDYEAHNNLGNAFYCLRRLIEAEQSYQAAIKLKPDYAEAHNNLGNVLFGFNRLNEAVKSYREAIKLKPDHLDAHCNLGIILNQLGELAEAETFHRKVLTLKPGHAETHNNLGITLNRLGRASEAEGSYRQAIKLKPGYAEAHNNLGFTLLKLGQLSKAEHSFREAIKHQPDFAEAYSNLGNILKEVGRLSEAEETYRAAIKFKPDYAEVHSNLGVSLYELGRLSEAIECYRASIKIKPDNTEAYCNLANALKELAQLSEAEESYREAIKLNPVSADAHYNLSLLQLLKGSFKEGWINYEYRKTRKKDPLGNRSFPVPLWLGDKDLKNKTILIHWEQGLGDTIQMCRYLKILVDEGACVLFAPQRQLQKLLSTLDERIKIVDIDDPHLKFDYHCPVMSLPLAFKTTVETIPKCVPYLSAEENRIAKWREIIGTDGFKIGICWSGSAMGSRLGRSFPLDIFYPISQIEGVRLISIHKGGGEIELKNLPNGMKVEVLGAEFDCGEQAFLDTAAVMKCCDLIITCDTAITVLGGALAVPTWIALKYIPHWFWMVERPDSPWYPTIKLFRQKKKNDWDGVFEDILNDLQQKLKC